MFKRWKRFSDFKLLAEYAKISDLRDSVKAWTTIQQVRLRQYLVSCGAGGVDVFDLCASRVLLSNGSVCFGVWI